MATKPRPLGNKNATLALDVADNLCLIRRMAQTIEQKAGRGKMTQVEAITLALRIQVAASDGLMALQRMGAKVDVT